MNTVVKIIIFIGIAAALIIGARFYANRTATTSPEDITVNIDATELHSENLETGAGDEAKTGDTVAMHYRGTLTNGEQFDSSYDRGAPFEFTLGAGEVIQGWDRGIPGMKVGGKRRLTIPSSLAYGSNGARNPQTGEFIIPPNATLVFEIELLAIK